MITALVLDDEPLALKLTRLVLEREGHRVIALSGWAAVSSTIADQAVDVAFVDVNMPGLSGDRLVQVLKSTTRWRKLPVVLISNLPMEMIREKAERSGADAWAQKPLTRADLSETLAKVLKTSCPVSSSAAQ